MMRHTAAHADGWNTMSFSPDFGEQLTELQDRALAMDRLCEEFGRDPSTLRRSVNLFDATARASGGRLRYYDDPSMVTDLVGALAEAGYREFGLYYPSDDSQRESFEAVAQEVVPALRAG